MHAISFQFKRAHLCTVKFAERVVRKIRGTTAARFDLLCLLRQAHLKRAPLNDPLTVGMTQKELWTRLDLSPSTICKMLARLEEMGWIRRVRDTRDRRRNIVLFTKVGLQRIWCATGASPFAGGFSSSTSRRS